jgi:LacI family gluconate utilization system Gnt-I transcriptional repressor
LDKKASRSQRVTLSEVAAKAGVSAITVSRVLNAPEKVSQARRERVEQAIEELGYIRNRWASALASARSNVIGVAIPSIRNVVFTDVVSAIYDTMNGFDQQVLLGAYRYLPMEEERLIETLIADGVEALILTGLDQTDRARSLIERAGLPVVQLMETGPNAMKRNVGFSHYKAGYDLTRFLLQTGHEDVGFIGAQMDPRTQRRMDGYKAALKEAGLDWRPRVVTTVESSSVKLGGELLRELLYRHTVCQAVFCCNDDLAFGALLEAQRMNLSVPDDIAIAGFNNLDMGACLNPALTTVGTRRYDMGKIAAEMMLADLGLLEEDQYPDRVDLGYEIIARGSTRNPT